MGSAVVGCSKFRLILKFLRENGAAKVETNPPVVRANKMLDINPATIDWSVEAGEVHCLVGENGSGKSTLIKLLPAFLLRKRAEE
jgi:ABC-type polysaccharide/polyol phosphate transport system ATPase subunit